MKKTKKTLAILVASAISLSALANSTVALNRVLGSVSSNKIRIAYTIASRSGCETMAVTVWSNEDRETALYEMFLDDGDQHAAYGSHTLTFSLDSSLYTLAQIKKDFPDAVVEIYADFCGKEPDYDFADKDNDCLKLVYSSSESSTLGVSDKVKSLYGQSRIITSPLVKLSDDGEDGAFDGYGLVKCAISRHNSKGRVKVKLSIKSFFGSQASSSVIVTPDESGSIDARLNLAGYGMFNVVGGEYKGSYHLQGFESTGTYEFDDTGVGGALANGTMYFDLDTIDIPSLPKKDIIEEILPLDYEVEVTNGTTINCGAVPKLGFVSNAASGTGDLPPYGSGWLLSGVNDKAKPNASSLKLKYSKVSGVFQGSFKVYYTNANYTSGKPKAKSATAIVRGVMTSDGVGVGMAGMKISGVKYFFPITLLGDVSE